MKLLTIKTDKGNEVGLQTAKGMINVTKEIPAIHAVLDIIQSGDPALKEIAQLQERAEEGYIEAVNEDQVRFASCIANPEKIICVGLNYQKHAEEANKEIPTSPILFNKYNNALTGHNEDIDFPVVSDQVDYEAELAIVIGKEAKEVDQLEALDYVFGYCCANDLSARDLQMKTGQWLLGKSLDGFCPLGPYLVTKDEIDNPDQLEISCYVNGELRQHSNTKDMIFNCKEIISYISQHMTLLPGDVILTGTPEGVVLGNTASGRKWLQPGDEMIVEIERLGKLSNTFIK
ncbi:fumarylacetoacetate hydrolase family protein [Gracilibacillus alcaliphilus]|uniref:fumarylacetoacetate hydrolase family protein n=1 Tax=Gracilibacillus alcaliphilus TaxID=1401441 RepID=UPI00195D41D8|nr:fumarylacetoacetate hydrolase family protein [Gracilibacillus alcaliphilus]MBM7679020.1 2-keto-4-pentenoate hydratase/2-oxohepta-3-ene-1,7-dioic acid hydratase in catechol pathway [Gracilibacillus alcaliphilus]